MRSRTFYTFLECRVRTLIPASGVIFSLLLLSVTIDSEWSEQFRRRKILDMHVLQSAGKYSRGELQCLHRERFSISSFRKPKYLCKSIKSFLNRDSFLLTCLTQFDEETRGQYTRTLNSDFLKMYQTQNIIYQGYRRCATTYDGQRRKHPPHHTLWRIFEAYPKKVVAQIR